jgi:hypothetical protein
MTLCLMYATVAAAIALVVLLKLGITATNLVLDGTQACGANYSIPFPDGSASSGCTFATPSGANGTTWTGEVNGLSTLDGEVSVTLVPRFPAIASLPISKAFVYSATLYGRRPVGDAVNAWSLVLDVTNATATLQCVFDPAPDPSNAWSCLNITLLNTAVLTKGQGGGGFIAYTASVAYADFNLTAPGLLSTVQYSFAYQTAAYRVSDLSVRGTLLCMTLIALALWTRSLLWQRMWVPGTTPGAPPFIARVYVPPRLWLPQQHLVTLLLLSTLLWINPIFVATQLQPETQVAQSVRLASLVVQFIGWGALFTFWWGMVDGFKLSELQVRWVILYCHRLFVFLAGIHSFIHSCFVRVSCRCERCFLLALPPVRIHLHSFPMGLRRV